MTAMPEALVAVWYKKACCAHFQYTSTNTEYLTSSQILQGNDTTDRRLHRRVLYSLAI